jgi:hypothetical protein
MHLQAFVYLQAWFTSYDNVPLYNISSYFNKAHPVVRDNH